MTIDGTDLLRVIQDKSFEYSLRQFGLIFKALQAGKVTKKSKMKKQDDSPEWQDLLWDLGVARPELNATIRTRLEDVVKQTLKSQKTMFSCLEIYPCHGSPEDEKLAFAKWYRA